MSNHIKETTEIRSSELSALLTVDSLKTYFFTRDAVVRAVDDVSFSLYRGETLGLVGESGCGKSATALSILQLLPTPPARIIGGSVRLEEKELLGVSEEEIRHIRGNDISMIFQEPMTSLNPVLTVGRQIRETIMLHQKVGKREAHNRTVEVLKLVDMPDPERRMEEYPHQLSGGMRQRVMIAMALSCNPKILIADEPTTALDVTIQAQIQELINKVKEKTGTAVILITHDLGLITEMAQRVAVMYAGRKIEEAPVIQLFATPRHPYTIGLMSSVPRLGQRKSATGRRRLAEIPGTVPSLMEPILGCAFAPRCPFSLNQCENSQPPLKEWEPGHWAACWNVETVIRKVHYQ